jgi:hypothetical protein
VLVIVESVVLGGALVAGITIANADPSISPGTFSCRSPGPQIAALRSLTQCRGQTGVKTIMKQSRRDSEDFPTLSRAAD